MLKINVLRQQYLFSLFLFKIVQEVLFSAIRKRKERHKNQKGEIRIFSFTIMYIENLKKHKLLELNNFIKYLNTR